MNILEIQNPLKTYLDKVDSIQKISTKETIVLIAQSKEGSKEARDKLIESNLFRVVEIAKDFASPDNGFFFDLIQEGNVGLIETVNVFCQFDYNPNFFNLNMITAVNRHMKEVITNYDRNINIPRDRADKVNEIDTAYQVLCTEFGRKPSIEEMSEHIGISLKILYNRLKTISRCRQTLSLDEIIDEENNISLADLIPDDYTLEDAVMRDYLSFYVMARVNLLTEREIKVITLHFGLDGEGERSLEEVGFIMNVTRERIRQIEAKAFRKLKHPRHQLRSIIED